MALLLLSLILLVHLPRLPASVGLKNQKSCRTYDISTMPGSTREVFHIDGTLVDKFFFCNAIRMNLVNHCFVAENIRTQYCCLDFSLDELRLGAGRKFLRTVVREESTGHNHDQITQKRKDEHAKRFLFTPTKLAVAIPAFFVLCCALICPCFQARKKGTGHTVIPKEVNSTDSISSLEMNSVSEKIMGSPLRIPPSPSRFSMSPKLDRIGSVHLTVNQVARVTRNFSSSLRIGEGGFGTVYKAELPDGQVVAIKRARKEYFEALQSEFRREVELLSKIDHRNLVKLLGYVEKGNERLIITEYVPGGTLREHLDGQKERILDFNQRLEISIDVAHGLTYLHLYTEKQIIHRDVKSSNILLTESMRAKVSDFGFARLGEDSDKSHVSTKVKGTIGYLDPEYMKTNKLTPKSDVFSFGMLLLEILTGRRPLELKRSHDERVTIRWAFRRYSEGKYKEMLDPSMNETIDKEILEKMFGLAIQCAAPKRDERPDMKTVGEQLWGIRMEYLRSGRGV